MGKKLFYRSYLANQSVVPLPQISQLLQGGEKIAQNSVQFLCHIYVHMYRVHHSHTHTLDIVDVAVRTQ